MGNNSNLLIGIAVSAILGPILVIIISGIHSSMPMVSPEWSATTMNSIETGYVVANALPSSEIIVICATIVTMILGFRDYIKR